MPDKKNIIAGDTKIYGDMEVYGKTIFTKNIENNENIYYSEKVAEFRVKNPLNFELNTIINSVEKFPIDSFVDIAGTTIGRGFTGVMKRWNFKGLRASHGVSKAHRNQGSTGQRTFPGKVFAGKKMAGHYGNERVTTQNLKVIYHDFIANGTVIAVKGSISGHKNGWCYIYKAVKKGVQNEI